MMERAKLDTKSEFVCTVRHISDFRALPTHGVECVIDALKVVLKKGGTEIPLGFDDCCTLLYDSYELHECVYNELNLDKQKYDDFWRCAHILKDFDTIGFKGVRPLEAGYVYAPYVPLMMSPSVYSH